MFMRALRGSEVFESPNSSFLPADVVLVRKILVSAIGVAPWDDGRELDDVDAHVILYLLKDILSNIQFTHIC
jgi:hypothetical protein